MGPVLRERRETLGLSLNDVEAAIRIRVHYLIALEADDWQRLPGEVAGRGFLQNYAEFLKLDGQAMKQRRQSAVYAALGEDWTATSAGASLPEPRRPDYRPLDSQAGQSAISGSGATDVWPRVLLWLIAVVGLGLFVLIVGWDFVPGAPDVPAIASLRATVTTWTQAATDRWARLTNRRGATARAPAPTPPLAVEVPPPQPTLARTPTPPLPTPASEPVAAPTAPADRGAPTLTPEPTAALAPAACPDAGARIAFPRESQVIADEVVVRGTAAIDDFWYYKLEYRLLAAGDQAPRRAFTYFDGSMAVVEDGALGFVNAAQLENGAYVFRLTVVAQDGAATLCEVTVAVRN